MSATLVVAIVNHLDVVYAIWHQIAKQLVVSLGRELKLAVV